MIGKVIRDFLLSDLLPYAEAIVHVYNRLGRRDNKYKARIKIMVHEHGIEDVRALVEDAFTRIKPEFAGADTLWPRSRRGFAPRICVPAKHRPSIRPIAATLCSARADTNLAPHRNADHAIVTVSIKAHGQTPGDATSAQMRVLADVACKPMAMTSCASATSRA